MANLKEDRIASLDKIIYLPSNISYLRNSIKKTQEQFGMLFGKKGNSISNWEVGCRMPDAVDLAVISNYFNLTMDELMFENLALGVTEVSQKAKTVSRIAKLSTESIDEIDKYIDFRQLK